jgi:hypothetical protein
MVIGFGYSFERWYSMVISLERIARRWLMGDVMAFSDGYSEFDLLG